MQLGNNSNNNDIAAADEWKGRRTQQQQKRHDEWKYYNQCMKITKFDFSLNYHYLPFSLDFAKWNCLSGDRWFLFCAGWFVALYTSNVKIWFTWKKELDWKRGGKKNRKRWRESEKERLKYAVLFHSEFILWWRVCSMNVILSSLRFPPIFFRRSILVVFSSLASCTLFHCSALANTTFRYIRSESVQSSCHDRRQYV